MCQYALQMQYILYDVEYVWITKLSMKNNVKRIDLEWIAHDCKLQPDSPCIVSIRKRQMDIVNKMK